MKATLILVGTELLNGGMVDTNSIYMANELNKYGIEIRYKITVKDDLEEIISAIEIGKVNDDLIIMSGGLGPTMDDLTKEAIAKYLNKKLIVNENELMTLKEKFKKINIEFLENNVKEVEKPEGAISFENGAGMAPAVYINDIVCFPGVPVELYDMFPKFLKWYSNEKKLDIDEIYIRDLVTYGIAESHLDAQIKDLFIYKGIEYEFLVKDYGILIRLQGKLSNKNLVEKIVEKIYNRIGINIFGENEDRLELVISKYLRKKNLKISVAESCTGGLMTSTFVNVSGISDVLYEGVVTYSNESKMQRLDVKKETLDKFGAVSEEVAKEMVQGLKSEVAISITGIAGPSGGTEEKPVGLVYIGIKIKDKIFVKKRIFRGSREVIRKRTVLYGLFSLYKLLKEGSK